MTAPSRCFSDPTRAPEPATRNVRVETIRSSRTAANAEVAPRPSRSWRVRFLLKKRNGKTLRMPGEGEATICEPLQELHQQITLKLPMPI